MTGWEDILDRLDAGARFDMTGLDADQVQALFVSRVSSDEAQRVVEGVKSLAQQQLSNKEFLANLIALAGSITGIVVQATKGV